MDLGRLFRPRSIAVIGGAHAEGVVRRCEGLGFSGPIWPVHPTRGEVAGRRAFRRVGELPEAPDAAFVAVNREATVEAVRALANRGAGGAVCYAAGFREVGGRGEALERALVEAAGGMPLLGPNCYGLINYLDGAALWFDQHGGRQCERGVAMVAQSGNVALNLTMQRRGLPVAFVVTLGNAADLGLAACVEALVADPRVTAIGLHVEGLGDPTAFDRAARLALAAGKPIVALKAGRSERGAELALSHTASLAGSGAAADALFARLGVARAGSLPGMLETLKLLHAAGPLPGRAVVSLSCSGGEAAMVADAAAGRRLDFRPFGPAEAARVSEVLGELVAVSNPLDYHTFVWGRPERLRAAFSAVLASGFDLGLLLLDLPRTDRCDPTEWRVAIDAWIAARDATGARAAVVATLPECLPEDLAEELLGLGVVPLAGVEDALQAVELAADIGAAQGAGLPASLLANEAPTGATATLDELEGKRLLAGFGVAHPEARRAASVREAMAAAEAIGFPVVLKALGAGLAHRTELGAVITGLREADAVGAAASRLLGVGEALLVERMVEDGVAELLVGVSRDPCVGLCLAVGAGGTLVELLADRALLLLPTTPDAVRAALSGLRVRRLLEGYRGRPPGDVEAAVSAVLTVARFAEAHADRLVELDVNPLIVRPAGRGAVAADVLLRLAPGS